MPYTYEITLAPSEEVSSFGAKHLGVDVEWPLWAHYLHETQAPFTPPGNVAPDDFRDTSVLGDYVKLLVARHGLDEAQLWRDSRIPGALPVPDISTYRGRYVPPKILGKDEKGRPIEDTSRSEYYEIKPNSDSGERDGLLKLENIRNCYKRYKLQHIYKPGTTWPRVSPTTIELKWSEAFEYLRLLLMWEFNLKQCDISLQVVRPAAHDGLVFYAIHIRMAVDDELLAKKLRAVAAAVVVAMGICAAAGVLNLSIGVGALGIAAEVLAELEAGFEAFKQALPDGPVPKVRVAPDVPDTRMRVSVPEEVPAEMPELEVELDDAAQNSEKLDLRRMAVASVLFTRARGLPGQRLDVFCDEDFFQNSVLDRAAVERFKQLVRVNVPASMTMNLAAGYLKVIVPGFERTTRMLEQIDLRLPNQLRLGIRKRIPEALRAIAALPELSEGSIVSSELLASSLLAAFLDPELQKRAHKRVDRAGGGLGRGKIVLPRELLAKLKGRDTKMAAGRAPVKPEQVVQALIQSGADEGARKYLSDALANADLLKHALNAAPGFTLAVGTHCLYTRPLGPVTAQTKFGQLQAVNVSRVFAVTARPGSKPPALYEAVDPATISDEVTASQQKFRYLGRLKVK